MQCVFEKLQQLSEKRTVRHPIFGETVFDNQLLCQPQVGFAAVSRTAFVACCAAQRVLKRSNQGDKRVPN